MKQGYEQRIANIESELAACRQELQQARAEPLLPDTIIETSIDPITLLDNDGRIVRANPALLKLLNCGREDLQQRGPLLLAFVEKGVHETTYGETIAIDQAYYEKNFEVTESLFKTGKIENHEFYIARFDKKLVPVEGNFSLLRDKEGTRIGAFAVMRDITLRKQVEAALRESQERFRALAMSAPEAIVAIDSMGTIIFWNRGAENVFLYTEPEILGKPIHQLLVTEDRPVDQEAFGKARKQNRDFFKGRYFLGRGLRKNGSVFATEVSIGMWETQQGNYYISIIRDVTQRQEMEEELQRAQAELEKKVADRTATLEEVNTALRVLLKRREEDKASLEEKVLLNMRRLINPCLEKLKYGGLDARQLSCLEILEANLQDIVSPFLQAISLKYLQLTPMEIEVANFIKHGHNTKKIAELLEVSRKTVEFHRNNIRRKADIKNKKINLRTYLLSLQ